MVLRTALAQVRGEAIPAESALAARDARQAARTYLNWFEQEAPEGAELFYVNSDYCMRYRAEDGMHNAIDYVIRLAGQRLGEKNAQLVIDAAREYLR